MEQETDRSKGMRIESECQLVADIVTVRGTIPPRVVPVLQLLLRILFPEPVQIEGNRGCIHDKRVLHPSPLRRATGIEDPVHEGNELVFIEPAQCSIDRIDCGNRANVQKFAESPAIYQFLNDKGTIT